MWNQSKPVPRATVRIKHALGSRFAAVTPPHPVAGSPDPISTGLTQLLRWMSGGGTVQQGPALQPINRRRVRSALSDSTPGWRSGCRSVLRCPKSLCPGRNGEGGGGGGAWMPLRQKSHRWCLRPPSPSSPRQSEVCGRDSASMPSWDKPLRAGPTR